MKNKTLFFTHLVSVCALFILGNAVIILPQKNADEYTFLVYMAVAVISAVLCIGVLPLVNLVFSQDEINSFSKKLLLAILYIAVAVFALFCAGDTFYDFGKFAGEVLLPDTSRFIIFSVFLLAIAFFCSRRQEDSLKFFLLCFIFCLALIIFFFFATAHNYSPRNIFIFRLPSLKTFISGAKPYLSELLFPSLLLPVYQVLVFKKSRKTALFCGATSGFIILGLCILSSLLLFGADFAGRLDYPYAAAVSTITVGRLFTRMDGFSYFIYFSASLCKITVCVFIIKSCLKRLDRLLKK